MDRDQLERIVAAVPGFRPTWDAFLKEWETEGEPGWYIGMTELAHYVVDSYSHGSYSELSELFSTVESVLENPDPEVDSLIAIGLFEDMQNSVSRREFGSVPIRQLLGPRGVKVWDEVDAGVKRVAESEKKQQPKWWQFWKKRRVVDIEKAIREVENPDLKKLLEADFRKKG